ncbi:AarF/ABC1/UbiB kinase family protein [Sinomonas sp. JGH33]|uniref:AarF/ABC1/UbiB kinase family protein n=1 Tax=Sinomonas terricola TaxID=3110330 RepID=A0ABU5TBD0_9MICC|nr:AarF/ABC1/UbiB kinase family protein [Sinomonas sp. JGH33]MEA5456837.1 AarF/ABC1/UbiB kinase family protein [Sinomonas sp. JGH33]
MVFGVSGSRTARYAQIAEVLTRHGMGHLLHATGLDRWAPAALLGVGVDRTAGGAVHLRLALEELGPTFMKLGQILSTRPDLLPEQYQTELAKLQDAAPPVGAEAIRAVVREELGIDAGEAFATFDDEPIASASIGQVHGAQLPDGTRVVVKVRKPGAVDRIREDLEILRNLAAHASRQWTAAADYNVVGLVEQFGRTILAELDYLQEGRNAERFAANFEGDARVRIPRVFWATTTSRVLTLERVEGLKINDIAALDAAGFDRAALAVNAAGVLAQMVFQDGFFHADPHPGNMFVQPDGAIALIDFGMVGEIDEQLHDQLGRLLLALGRKDPRRLARALMDMSTSPREADVPSLADDVAGFISLYDRTDLQDLNISRLAQRLLAVIRAHRLQMPAEVAVISKMVVMAEGLGRVLDPKFRLSQALRPYVLVLFLERHSPQAFLHDLRDAGLEAIDLVEDLPHLLNGLVRIVDSGGLEVRLRAEELEPLMSRAERIGDRVVAGVIAAAFIRGVGDLVSMDRERWTGWRAPFMRTGLAALGGLGGYFAWSAARRARHRRS